MTVLDIATVGCAGYSAWLVLTLLALRTKAQGLGVAPLFVLPFLVLVDLFVGAGS